MEVYRICLTKYARSLQASGRPARWNQKGDYMIYTAGSISLACLENLVHRSGTDLALARFSIVTIGIPETVKISKIDESYLSKQHTKWFEVAQYSITQTIGQAWLNSGSTAILKVPSAIIPSESNFLVNPQHPDAKLLSFNNISEFSFDKRLYSI